MKHSPISLRRALLALLASGLFGAVAPAQAAGLCYDPVSHGMVPCPTAGPGPTEIVQEIVKTVTEQVIQQAAPPSFSFVPSMSENSCGNSAGYYQERYESCMKTDSRGANYCISWSGCPSKVSQ